MTAAPAPTGSRPDRGAQRDPAREVAAGFPVTDRPSWVMLVGIALLVAAAVAWAVFGRAPDAVTGSGMVVPATGFEVIGQAVTGTVEDVNVAPGDVVRTGEVMAYVREEDGQLTRITAPMDGRVVAVLARAGTVTLIGSSIFSMVPLDGDNVVVAFIAAGPGKRVQVGLPARVSLASVPRSQYGSIEGKVTAIAPVPTSMERVLLMVGGNESLANYFLSAGPVLEVTVSLNKAETPTGYQWTVGQGPDEPVTTGTLANVSVVLSDSTPLERIL